MRSRRNSIANRAVTNGYSEDTGSTIDTGPPSPNARKRQRFPVLAQRPVNEANRIPSLKLVPRFQFGERKRSREAGTAPSVEMTCVTRGEASRETKADTVP